MTFRFLPSAEAELLEAVSYYSGIRTELGTHFEEAVAMAIRAAAAHPERGARRSKNSRRWPVKRFPYGVIYSNDSGDVLIVAIAHERRKPAYWEDRI